MGDLRPAGSIAFGHPMVVETLSVVSWQTDKLAIAISGLLGYLCQLKTVTSSAGMYAV